MGHERVAVVGIGQTKHEATRGDVSVAGLLREAAGRALADAEMTPYRGPSGATTTLNESVFSTIPGSPAWVSKANTYHRHSAKYGLADIDLRDHNAVQEEFRFVA